MKTYLAPSGLQFRLTGATPYIRKNKTQTSLDVWTSTCKIPGCGEGFDIKVPSGTDPAQSRSFGMVHCPTHRLSREEATRRWVSSCKAANTKATPRVVSEIKDLHHQGLKPADIALFVDLSVSRIYAILKS